MSYNTVKEIKRVLLLEAENQTLTDEEITEYLSDAQMDLFSEIKRNRETDVYRIRSTDLNDDDEAELPLFFNVLDEGEDTDGIIEVRNMTDKEVISATHYELIRGNQAIKIKLGESDADISVPVDIEIDYIPINYKMTERALCVFNILSRIAPFQNEQINPNLINWREKKQNYIDFILSKFGSSSYW